MDNSNIQAKIEAAGILCDKGQFDEAYDLLSGIVSDAPNVSEAWRMLAQIDLTVRHDDGEAYDELIEALRLDPKNIWALILMGNLLMGRRKDYKEAKVYFDRVLEYYPENVIALNNIAASMSKQGEYYDALIFFDKALKGDPSYAPAIYGLSATYYNMGDFQMAFNTVSAKSAKVRYRPENGVNAANIMNIYVSSAMKLMNSTDYKPVLEKMERELQNNDGLPIIYREDNDMAVSAQMEYGPAHGRTEHVLVYNPKNPFFAHLCAHELMHLRMMQRNTAAGKG